MSEQRTTKADATRRRVLDAASALFAGRGFEATSTRAIADAAGVAHGTVFRYAATKEDLVEQLFHERIGAALDVAERSSPPLPASFAEVALHWSSAFFDAYVDDPALAAVIVKELPFLRGAPLERQNALTLRLFSAWTDAVEERQRVGLIPIHVAPMLLVSAAFALYYGALVGWLSGQLDKDGALTLLREQLALLAPASTSSLQGEST